MILGCIYTISIYFVLATCFVVTCKKRRQIQQNAPTNLAKRNTDMAFSKTMCHQCRCVCLCRTTVASLRSFSETSKNWVFSYRNLLKYINFRVCIDKNIRKDTVNAVLGGGGMHGFRKRSLPILQLKENSIIMSYLFELRTCRIAVC